VWSVCVWSSCKEGDLVMFTWEEAHSHYVACLSPDAPKHFLHHECLQQLGVPLSCSLYYCLYCSVHSTLCTLLLPSSLLVEFCLTFDATDVMLLRSKRDRLSTLLCVGGQPVDRSKLSMLLQITSRDYCLAKKVLN